MDEQVKAIERAAFEAWPAAEIRELGGWRLRFNHGVTNRGNSVWPGPGQDDGRDLGARLDAVETFYRKRRRPAVFQLTPIAEPGELDAALEARDYQAFSPVDVQTADALPVAGLPTHTAVKRGCEELPSPAWIQLATHRGRYTGAQADVFLAMLGRLKGRAGFAWAGDQNGPAACGLGVVAPPWAGVFAMRTLDAARGRGLGRAVLIELAGWAVGRRARHLYLQVEQDNEAALALYRRAGFSSRYAYHYRKAYGR